MTSILADLPMFVGPETSSFRKPVACSHLIPKKTISGVLDHVASDDAQFAVFARDDTIRRMDEIKAKAQEEFEGRYYWGRR